MQDSNLANRLELWGFEDGVMVFKDFSLGCGFEIQSIDISSESDEAINILKHQIRQFLNGLPSKLSIQFIQAISGGNDKVIAAHGDLAKNSLTDFQKEILKSRMDKFTNLDDQGTLPRQRLFVFIRKKFEISPKKRKFNWMFWKAQEQNLKEAHLKTEIQKFDRVIENIISQFAGLEIKAEKLSEQDTFGLLYSQWNPDRPIVESEISSHDVRDQVCLTDSVIGIDNFSIGKIYHKVISLKMFPENTFASMAQALKNLPFESRLFFSVEVLDQQKEIASLQTQWTAVKFL